MKILIRNGGAVTEAGDALKQTAGFKAIEADTARYSITPTTFDTRTYETDLDCWYHVDNYTHKSSGTFRFGLNDKGPHLLAAITSECKSIDVSVRPPSTVKSGKYLPTDAQKITLCSLEQHLINMALEHLVTSGQKAVVVDILARMNGGVENGFVKVDKGVPEIHSVVLYLNPPAAASAGGASAAASPVISVIDPSNLLFSVHLSNYAPVIGGTTYEMKTFHKGIQIYKPEGTTGPHPDQFRDCIDAAVKLAMNFNASAMYYDLSDLKVSLFTCPIVQLLSNIKTIDPNILSEELPVRVKQVSDPVLVDKFNKLERIVGKNLISALKILDSLAAKNLSDECDRIMDFAYDYIIVRNKLCEYNIRCIDEMQHFCDGLKAEHTVLLGELA